MINDFIHLIKAIYLDNWYLFMILFMGVVVMIKDTPVTYDDLYPED